MFAVRRPAVRPGHRPSEGGLPVRRDGRLTPAPVADRSWHRDERGLPVSVPGRRTLARFLLAPPGDGRTEDWPGVTGAGCAERLGAWARVAVSGAEFSPGGDGRTEDWPGATGAGCAERPGPSARAAVSGAEVSPGDGRTEERVRAAVSGTALVRGEEARTAEWREGAPVRVLWGRPVDRYARDTAPRLGATTAGLLERHVVEVRPAGARGMCAPAAVPEITRRERRPLPGVSAPRVR